MYIVQEEFNGITNVFARLRNFPISPPLYPPFLLILIGSYANHDSVTSDIEKVKLEVDLKKSELDRLMDLAQELSKTGHQTTLTKTAHEFYVKYQVCDQRALCGGNLREWMQIPFVMSPNMFIRPFISAW